MGFDNLRIKNEVKKLMCITTMFHVIAQLATLAETFAQAQLLAVEIGRLARGTARCVRWLMKRKKTARRVNYVARVAYGGFDDTLGALERDARYFSH